MIKSLKLFLLDREIAGKTEKETENKRITIFTGKSEGIHTSSDGYKLYKFIRSS
jgi:hypothetical protein